MIHDVRQAIGYHGNELKRYDVLAGKADGFRPIFTAQIWRLLNVRYLLTNLAALQMPGLRDAWPVPRGMPSGSTALSLSAPR